MADELDEPFGPLVASIFSLHIVFTLVSRQIKYDDDAKYLCINFT